MTPSTTIATRSITRPGRICPSSRPAACSHGIARERNPGPPGPHGPKVSTWAWDLPGRSRTDLMRSPRVNPRQRRGLLLIAVAALGLVVVFVLVAGYVGDVRKEVDPKVTPARARQARRRRAGDHRRHGQDRDDAGALGAADARCAIPAELVGLVAGTDLEPETLLQKDMLKAPPQLAPGQRELAILVDAETGVAGKIGPDSIVDVIATYPGRPRRKAAESRVVVPGARIIEVGQPRLKGGRGVQEQAADPEQVVPVTFALTPEQALLVSYAESNATEVRLALLRPGDEEELSGKERAYQREPDPVAAVSQRLLLAIADRDVASSAAALAQEGEGLEVVARRRRAGGGHARAAPPRRRRRRAARRARRHAGARPRARARPGVSRDRARPDRRRRLARAAARRDAGRAARRRLAPAVARAARVAACAPRPSGRARCASASRARSRPPAALGGRLIAVAGAKGGVGTTTVALQLALAAIRAMPGRPVCVVDFDLQKGDLRAFLDLPHRRSVGRPGRGRVGDLRPPPAGDALHAQEGFRVLLAPDEGERARGDRLRRRPLGAQRGQGAPRADRRRPRRAGLRGERDRRRDRQPAWWS